jgi:cellulose synthase/poly-beta-1,6-N-acetylglucosamine synthase-like glycosyltransferase
MVVIELVFWTSALLLAYVYAGFPALLWLRSELFRKPVCRSPMTPELTIVIVAHNESATIGQKLNNLFALDYPRERLHVIVASDGSDDGTDDIVSKYKKAMLLSFPRLGKIPALNEAVQRARGEILVFSDANSMLATDALRVLMRPFADATVGGVAGMQCYFHDKKGSETGAGESAYWSFDQMLKRWQSDVGSVTSATGAIYAMRRRLFKPLPCGVSDDAMNSYYVVASGYRMVFEPGAVAYETVAPSGELELKRKVRVCVRGLHGIAAISELLNPFRFGFYAIQLLSHKLLRWKSAWAVLALGISAVVLRSRGLVYSLTGYVVVGFAAASALVMVLPRKVLSYRSLRLVTFPFYFCLANLAFMIAQIKVARGKRIDAWEVQRERVAGQRKSCTAEFVGSKIGRRTL